MTWDNTAIEFLVYLLEPAIVQIIILNIWPQEVYYHLPIVNTIHGNPLTDLTFEAVWPIEVASLLASPNSHFVDVSTFQ